MNVAQYPAVAAATAGSLPSSDTVRTEFDGQELTVSIERATASTLAFGSSTDTVLSLSPLPSPVPDHTMGYWNLLSPTPEGASISAHFISWDNADRPDT